jgi:hypothetical protein
MITRTGVYIVLLFMFLLSKCVSTDRASDLPGNVFSGYSSGTMESKDKIDKWKTFELFFTLDNPEDCIKINIISEIFDEISNKKIFLKTYFTVEKAVDVSKFSKENAVLYSEMGRNFDYNWTAKQDLEICSSDSDPIKKLNKSGKYRIRFTIFKDINFKYNININSKNKIHINEK